MFRSPLDTSTLPHWTPSCSAWEHFAISSFYFCLHSWHLVKKIIFFAGFLMTSSCCLCNVFPHTSVFPQTVLFQMECIKASQILVSVFFLWRESSCYAYSGIT
ncbi:E4 ORF1 [bat adenovirus 10]|uniref:E4 ORF1 n=1 Tax=bat adenovirus 10 TaxID=3070193 RepID=A0A1X9RIV5_9ADEN|nr:E4 ORF1 [Bat mastadenovirus WIV18]ARQ79800.1 E4 ORF1 [bat adenovirus 10]